MVIHGIGFDGSSIRGFQPINESDMLIKPDTETAFIDPFMADPTLSMICNVKDPLTQVPYSRDPRNVGQKAERYLSVCGIADQVFFGPEPEFYIFDDVRFEQTYNTGFYRVDSKEGFWNTARDEGPESRIQAPVQGRLLSGAAHGQPSEPQGEDVQGDDGGRHPGHPPSP